MGAFAVARGGWGAVALLVVLFAGGTAVGQVAPPPPAPVPAPVIEIPGPASPLPPPAALPPPSIEVVPAQAPATLPEAVPNGLPTIADPVAMPGATPAPAPAPSGPGADGTPLNDYWRSGLKFESKDKAFSLFVGGRFQFDVVDYLTTMTMRKNIPGTNPLEDGVSFRRIRFDMGGTLYKNMEYYAQVDFANGFLAVPNTNQVTNATYPTDMWLQYKDLPVLGTIRVGNQKPLYSFEHLVSSRFLPFMERSLGYDAFSEHFNNGFEPGITVLNTYMEKRGTWGLGLFKTTRNPFGWNVGRNEAEVNGRVTFLPVYEDDGKLLVHVGVGGAHRDLDQDQARFRARLDARNSPSAFSPLIAETGLFFGQQQQLIVPELVAVAGPWTFQSEYYGSWVGRAAIPTAAGTPGPSMGTVFMQSAYGEVHYFLTGEHRAYNRETGVFGRVVPKRNFAWNNCGFTGWGAWQLAARYSYLDLIDKGINGGRVHDMTLGLNWFMNPNMKVQWNYFLAHRNVANPGGDGFIQGFAVRTAIDF